MWEIIDAKKMKKELEKKEFSYTKIPIEMVLLASYNRVLYIVKIRIVRNVRQKDMYL